MKKVKDISQEEKLCFHLLGEFPLYAYRVPQKSNTFKLNILLLGEGTFLECLLRVLISQGQLLNTTLSITLASNKSEEILNTLMKEAPYLPNFAKIKYEDKIIAKPTNKQDILVNLIFQNQIDLSKNNDFSYAIISAENTKMNRTSLNICKKYLSKDALYACLDLDTIKAFDWNQEDEICKELDRIGLNFHIAYTKKYMPEASVQEIKAQFHKDPYTYSSNIQAALHVYAKLGSCDILCKNTKEAADQFHTLLQEDGTILYKLAALEHRRWMLDKVLDGYCQLDDISKIYQDGATTHDAKEKWHCCLVNSDISGKSKLPEEDWDMIPATFLDDLDPLDKITYQVHKQCKKIFNVKKAQALLVFDELQKRVHTEDTFSETTRQLLREVNIEFIHLCHLKKGSAERIDVLTNDLRKQIQNETKDKVTLAYIDSFKENYAPIVEYVAKKDYKSFDRYLVEAIPFCLTNKCNPSIIKLLSNQTKDNIYALTQLEAKQVTFISTIFSMQDLNKTSTNVHEIKHVLKNLPKDINVQFILFTTPSCKDKVERTFAKQKVISINTLEDEDVDTITSALEKIEEVPDYIDLTGADYNIIIATSQCKKYSLIAKYFIKDGKFQNTFDAKELSYKKYAKPMHVAEMFQLIGVDTITTDSSHCDISVDDVYKIWKVRKKYEAVWNQFTKLCGHHYDSKSIKNIKFKPIINNKMVNYTVQNVPMHVLNALLPSLKQLEKENVLKNLTKKMGSNSCTLSFQTYEIVKKMDEKYNNLTDFINQCVKYYQPEYVFTVTKSEEAILLKCDELKIDDFPSTKLIPEGKKYKNSSISFLCSDIFKDLKAAGAIRKYSSHKVNGDSVLHVSFSSYDAMKILTMAGNALEYYVYTTSFAEAGFNDAEMSVEFSFENFGDAAENEIDVICTDDSNSIFISCKDVNSLINYQLYEISLEANLFGINPKACIAAPKIPMFSNEKNKIKDSPEFKRAKSRGVYLIGKECFKDPKTLGKALRNIMDGKDDWYNFLK